VSRKAGSAAARPLTEKSHASSNATIVAWLLRLVLRTQSRSGGVFYPCPSVSIRGLIPSTPEFMHKQPSSKYRPFPAPSLPTGSGPTASSPVRRAGAAWICRDGNQALAVPMNVSQKLELFQTLVKIGFKEIEIGFPAASNTEFAFNRRLIEENRAPDDVWLQVLVQAREDLIERTFESLVGAKQAIIHLYNSTSPAQRRVVFGKSKSESLRSPCRAPGGSRNDCPGSRARRSCSSIPRRASAPPRSNLPGKFPRRSWRSGSPRRSGK